MKEVIKEYMVNFLVWMKDNHFYQYKDGTWYTTNERNYVYGKPRKYYTEEEVIELFMNK